MVMKIEWIVKITIVMALFGGCALQRQNPPSTAAAEPVAAKKQLSPMVDQPTKPVVKPKVEPRVDQPAKPVIEPRGEPTKRLAANPIVESDASAALKVASKPDLRPKVTVAESAPATKKASVPKSPEPQTQTSSKQTASRTDTSNTVPSKLSPDEGKKAEKADQKVKERADTDSETLLAMKTWVFDEEHLPRTLPGDWVLDIRPDQLGNDRRCLLYSARKSIFDGYDDSWIRLQITTDAIVVNTDSYVDTSYPEQGLRIDNGKLIPFMPSLLNKKTAYTKRPAQAVMANGTTLTVSLGFWPTWPVTRTQSVSIDLTGFNRAYSALKACSAAQ
jgi:hypothetical protein